jgi:MFS transporter, DHA2 family, multidrug resistance protein
MSQLADIGVTGLAGVSGFIQPKYLMAAAMLTIALAMYHFSVLSPGAGFAWFATARVYQMAVLPVLFLTITSFSYVGLPPEKSSQASALINVARNLGGSIGVSTAQTILVRRGQFHQSHLSGHIFPSSVQFRETLRPVGAYFMARGGSVADSQSKAIGWVGRTVVNRAASLSYVDVFAALGLLALMMIPVAFTLSRVDLGRRAAAG